jgi:TPR repeat protein
MLALFFFAWACVAFAQNDALCQTDYLEEAYKAVNTEREHQINHFFASACDCGNLEACANLAFSHAYGLYLETDFDMAVTLWQKSCAGGYAEGCYQLGMFYTDAFLWKTYSNTTRAANRQKARESHQKACKLGHEAACALGQ